LRRAPDRLSRLALIGAHPLAETTAGAAAARMLIVKVKSGGWRIWMQRKS